MAIKVGDRIYETSTSSGLGSFDLNGAVAGFQSFVAGIGTATQTYYAIVSPNGEWETGLGTVTVGVSGNPNRISRDTILSSSTGGTAVNFAATATPKDIFCDVPASSLVFSNVGGGWTVAGDVTLSGKLTALGSLVKLELANDAVSPRLQSYGSKSLIINELGNTIKVGSHLMGLTDNADDLGDPTHRFRNLYLGSNATIGGTLTSGTHTVLGSYNGTVYDNGTAYHHQIGPSGWGQGYALAVNLNWSASGAGGDITTSTTTTYAVPAGTNNTGGVMLYIDANSKFFKFLTAPTSTGVGLQATLTNVFQINSASVISNMPMFVNGAAGTARDYAFQTATINRWILRVDTDAETGSNAGSTFRILARTDAGAAIDNVLSITRAAGGSIAVNRPIVMTGSLAGQGATNRYLSGGGNSTSWYINAATGGTVWTAIGESLITTANTNGLIINAGGLTAFTDNTIDIGNAGSSRFRDLNLARNAVIGNTLTVTAGANVNGALVVGTNVATLTGININSAVQVLRDIHFQTAGVARWTIRIGSEAETGGGVGSNFNIIARDDAGTVIDNPIFINRVAGGVMSLARPTNFAKTVAIGGANPLTYKGLFVGVALTGSSDQRAVDAQPIFDSGATTNGIGYYSQPATAAAAFTLASVYGFYAADVTKGAGSTITNQYGLYVANQTQGANSYAIYTNAGRVRFGDTLGINGAAPTANQGIVVGGALGANGTSQYGVVSGPTYSSATTNWGVGFYVNASSAAATFTMGQMAGMWIDVGGKGAGSTISNQYGLYISNQTLGAANYAIFTNAGTVSLGDRLIAGTDNSYDIGASGANRFRDLFLGRNAVVGGTLQVSGNATFNAQITQSYASPVHVLNDSSGAGFATMQFASSGAGKWYVGKGPADNTQNFQIYNIGLSNTPFQILAATNATSLNGAVTMSSGATVSNGLTVSSGTTAVQALTATTGLLSSFLTVQDGVATVAAGGSVRLPNAGTVRWRSAANNDDLRLYVNASNVLVFDNNSASVQQPIAVGKLTTTAGASDGIVGSVSGAFLSSSFQQLTASTDFVSRWLFQNGVFWDMRGVANDGSLNFTYNGNTTPALKLTTGGDALISGGIRQFGSIVARFENTFATVPTGGTGVGVEIGISSTTTGQIQAYNRTTPGYAPLFLFGSTVTVGQGPLIVGSDPGGTSSDNMVRAGSLQAAGFAGFASYNNSTSVASLSGMRMYNINGVSVPFIGATIASNLQAGGSGVESTTLDFYTRSGGVHARRMYLDTGGSLVLGTDPGSSELLRLTGTIRAANAAGNFLIMKMTAAPADSKNWWHQIITTDGTYRLRAVNDAENTGANAFTVTRSGIGSLVMGLVPDGGNVVIGASTVSQSMQLWWDATGGHIQTYAGLALQLNPQGNPVYVGADPGGSETLRIGGAVKVTGGVTLANSSITQTSPNAAPTVSQTAQALVTNTNVMSMAIGFVLGYGMIYDSSSGHSCLFVVRGAGAAIIWQDASGFTGTVGTGGASNIYVTGGVLTVQNNTGQTASYSLITFKLA